MKTKFYFTSMLAVVLMSAASCSKVDQPVIPEDVNGHHVCKMTFNGAVEGYDNAIVKSASTKASGSSWSDGDRIYITFYDDETMVPGEATYTNADGWSISYDGSIGNGTGLKCEVRYFVNATFQSSSLVSLNANSEIYETTNATYDYNGTQLTVTATLTPKTGRIRFTGTAASTIYLTGLDAYTTYAPGINTFSTTKSMIKATVASTGSTPYIYCKFSDSSRTMGLVGSDFAFTRVCSEDVLKVGDSGYMAIPSDASHNKWKNGLYVKVGNNEMKLIPVSGLSSGFFLIGETEVTVAQYNSVVGTSSSTSKLPKTSLAPSEWKDFISKLNYMTNLNFSFPSPDQWKFAAKGGSFSQGYSYSGSNNPGDVAWYIGNSGSVLHEVKQLTPNELGIYDMSGNAYELTSGYSYNYSTYYDYYGGSYISSESELGILNRINELRYDQSTNKVGLRVVLTCE